MKLKRVGFFKELKHGDEFGISLKEIVCNSPLENEDKIVGYLENGIAFCITGGLVSDVLDESKGVISNLEILTDGTWAWPSDLSYYVKFYHIKLDRHFIEHVEKNGWTIQNKNDIDLLKLEF